MMTKQEICEEFEIEMSELNGVDIIFTCVYGEYISDNNFLCLFKKDEKLFAVWASSCSCYAFEGQWEPEEITKEALEFIVSKQTSSSEKDKSSVVADALEALEKYNGKKNDN